eukprot:scaffold314355_cov14-Tisochrysis_lutea.AAC.1
MDGPSNINAVNASVQNKCNNITAGSNCSVLIRTHPYPGMLGGRGHASRNMRRMDFMEVQTHATEDMDGTSRDAETEEHHKQLMILRCRKLLIANSTATTRQLQTASEWLSHANCRQPCHDSPISNSKRIVKQEEQPCKPDMIRRLSLGSKYGGVRAETRAE